MATLLLRMRAPMMSWGDHSRFTNRDSRREPTKSAVLGLVCAALGRPRTAPIHDLAALRMGVRVNAEGVLLADYHTVMEAIRSSGARGDTVVSHRYYVADADYLVGLESPDPALLETIDTALRQPVWQICFGRKSFVPTLPVRVGLRSLPLEQALQQEVLPQRPGAGKPRPGPSRRRLVLEVAHSLDVRTDVPLDWQQRRFGSRCVETRFVEITGDTHVSDETAAEQPQS